MIKILSRFTLLLLALVLVYSCDPDEPDPPMEEEVITTLNYTLTPNGGGDAVVMSFVDLDGDGANAPVITGGTLAANTTYAGSLELLNQSVSPEEDITEEIMEEDDEHQFFFVSSISDLSVAYADVDGNSNPVGLSSTLTTGEAGTGSLTITLVHEPVKDATGVSDGDIANAGGSIDIMATFDVDVQ